MKQLIRIIGSYVPTKLPVGMTEFDVWAKSIAELLGPITTEESVKFALATMLMHITPPKNSYYNTMPSRVPKNHFVQCLRSSIAKQVAGQVFQDIKLAQLEAQKKAQEEANIKQAEVTVSETPQSVQA